MKLIPIKTNMIELEIPGYRILFSYQTPVTYYHWGLDKFYKTEDYYSKTASKHINNWVGEHEVFSLPQSAIDCLIARMK